VNTHPITAGKEDRITGTLKYTKRKEIYPYGADGWFPVDPCTDIEIYHIGRTDALCFCFDTFF
jgi:hypothetical protein